MGGCDLGAAARAASKYLQRFGREYLLEWQVTDQRDEARLRATVDGIAAAVNGHDATVFVKPGGLCPFCNMTVSLLKAAQQPGGAAGEFSLHVADLLHEEREALKLALAHAAEVGDDGGGGAGAPKVLLYPVIYLRGVRLAGGYEELKRAHDSGGLGSLLRATPRPFDPILPAPPAKVATAREKLLHQAGGDAWCTFHTYIYGNVLRLIALQQVALAGIALGLYHASLPLAAAVVLAALAADCAAFVLLGPTPYSPLGCAATLLVWRRRGAVASAMPYKVVFGLYAAALLYLT